jgi:hypothetical protein
MLDGIGRVWSGLEGREWSRGGADEDGGDGDGCFVCGLAWGLAITAALGAGLWAASLFWTWWEIGRASLGVLGVLWLRSWWGG